MRSDNPLRPFEVLLIRPKFPRIDVCRSRGGHAGQTSL